MSAMTADAFRRASAHVPELRLPHPEPAPLVILVDTREQSPRTFPEFVGKDKRPVVTRVVTLAVADYTTEALQRTAVIERKSASDFMATITADRERWDREVDRFAQFDRVAVVVEADRSECAAVAPGVNWRAVESTIADLFVRHGVAVSFQMGRVQAAYFVARWLWAAERVLLPRPTPLERLHGVALGLGL